MRVEPFKVTDYVQVQRGVHAGKEGEVLERKPKPNRHGDELVILVEEDRTMKRYSVDPLNCAMCKRPAK